MNILNFREKTCTNLQKFAESVYIFLAKPDEFKKCNEMIQSGSSDDCICPYNIKILNFFNPELQLINTKPITKNKLKELLSELKKFKFQSA